MKFEGLRELLSADEKVETKLETLAYQYNERLKEQALVNGISAILFDRTLEREYILRNVVDMIPPGWQYPEITVARFRYKDIDIRSPGYRETPGFRVLNLPILTESPALLMCSILKRRWRIMKGLFLKRRET